MIEHAWTVICSNSWIDQQTGNMSMQVVDQLNYRQLPPAHQGVYLLPVTLHIVSFWFRRGTSAPESQKGFLVFQEETGHVLQRTQFEVAFDRGQKARSRDIWEDLPMRSPGLHELLVQLGEEGQADRLVARVPLMIRALDPKAS